VESEEQTVAQSTWSLSYDCTVTEETGYTNGQSFPIQVVTVQGFPVEVKTADALLTMMEAAENAGVPLKINDAFRTWDEQAYFYHYYTTCSCNNCNPAAPPGYSNHQSGHAIDFDMGGGRGAWIFANAPSFGWDNDEGASVGEDWHWTWWGGGSPKAFCSNQPPWGSLDHADDQSISGWAFDEDAGETAIDVHIYFNAPAGSDGAHGVSVLANVERDDLCSVVGSCNHGFRMHTPLSLCDGADHAVYAYGINVPAGVNPQLNNSPKTLHCDAKLPAGIARRISTPDIYGTWKFSSFYDHLPIDGAAVDAIPRGENLPDEPLLVLGPKKDKVYLVDGDVKRHIPDPWAMLAWHFEWAAVQDVTDVQLAAWQDGPSLRVRPVVVENSEGELWLIDDEIKDTSSAGAGGTGGSGATKDAGPEGSGGASAQAGSGGSKPSESLKNNWYDHDDGSSGCACGLTRSPGAGWLWSGLFGFAVLVGARRRRASGF